MTTEPTDPNANDCNAKIGGVHARLVEGRAKTTTPNALAELTYLILNADDDGRRDDVLKLQSIYRKLAALVEAARPFENTFIQYGTFPDHYTCQKTQTVGECRALSAALREIGR